MRAGGLPVDRDFPTGRLGEMSCGHQGETRPPEPGHHHAQACRQALSHAEPAMSGHQSQGESELEAASHVAVGISLARQPVHGVSAGGDLRQEGVIEDVAADVGNLGDQKEEEGLEDIARLAEVEQYREQGARVGAGQQETLLGSRHIGDRAQGRR